MQSGSFVIVLFLFLLSGFFVLRPIFISSNSGRRAGSTRRDSLVAERERLLNAIEELDLEFELEKISPAEHARNRDILLAEAAVVLRDLDDLPSSKAETRKQESPKPADDDLERMIAERRKQLKGKKLIDCPHCGKSVEKGAQFCSQCGGAL